MTEKNVERKLVEGVKKLGGMAYKWVSPGNDGVPDRVVVLPNGHVVFVELKTDKGRLSALQKRQIARLTKLNASACEVRGASGVEKFLEHYGKEVEEWRKTQ